MADITYCEYSRCENTACARNKANAPFHTHLSIGSFHECEHFKKYLKELAEKEEQDAIEEARREAMRLDDNEDTLAYRGHIGE